MSIENTAELDEQYHMLYLCLLYVVLNTNQVRKGRISYNVNVSL